MRGGRGSGQLGRDRPTEEAGERLRPVEIRTRHGAPTDVVRDLTGREPEDFETICRRYVAERPEAVPSLGGKVGALSRLIRAALMRTPDMEAFERAQHHPPLLDPVFAQDAPEWRATHLQANGG
jgi:hypothetical protein